MSGDTSFRLENHSSCIVTSLRAKKSEIPWASNATALYEVIEGVYTLFKSADELSQIAKELALKVKELEKYSSTSLAQHITLKNANEPFFLHRAKQVLSRVLDSCNSHLYGGSVLGNSGVERLFTHLAAELQALCNEYGFCSTFDAIYHVDEATSKIESLSQKLTKIESIPFHEPEVVINALHSIEASLNGIKQAMTQQNIDQMQQVFDEMSTRIINLENSFFNQHLQEDSAVFTEYLAQHYMVRKPLVSSICSSYSQNSVNEHMIHPGTRNWIMERIDKFLHESQKRLFFISGKQGTGKSALCSAILKMHNYEIIAYHFFNASQRNVASNTLNGLIQSIAAGMCATIPEYINWLDDKYSGKSLSHLLNVNWQQTYRVLLKEPIQDLYGHGRSASSHLKRKMIVIDGLDEMAESDYANFKAFTSAFTIDLSVAFCLLVTVRSKKSNLLIENQDINIDGVRFEDRTFISWHIKDLEIYLSSSLGAVLSGEDEMEIPEHAKADETTLQKTVDELLKSSAGRFDFAVQLMEAFAKEFSVSGQFLGSLRKCALPLRNSVGNLYDQKMIDFASPYRSYRDKEGRSVKVRVLRKSQYLMDKTRVALIRGRHRVHDLNHTN